MSDRYLIIEKKGWGGFGDIFLARDLKEKRECAIKEYRKEITQELACVNLNHPHLIPITDRFVEDGLMYEVMPYYSFGSIDKFKGSFSEKVAWRLLYGIAEGLDCLHSHGFYHLDIKPWNILLNDVGIFVLADYSVPLDNAKIIPLLRDRTLFPNTSDPELAYYGINAVSDKSKCDIWSLGLTVYYMLTAKWPFDERRFITFEVFSTIYNELSSRYSRLLSNTICSCFTLNPIKRPSARHLLNADQWADEWTLEAAFDESDDWLSRINIKVEENRKQNSVLSFLNTYTEKAKAVYIDCIIAEKDGKYAVTDSSGLALTEYIYDDLSPFREVNWPSAGPCPPINARFLGAYFRQGNECGYLYIDADGSIKEDKRVSISDFQMLHMLT